MTEPVTIGYGANKWVKDANTKMKSLVFPSTNSVFSFHDSETGTNYQVPVGKKFIVLHIATGVGEGNAAGNKSSPVYFGTTVDSLTGATMISNNLCAQSYQGYASGMSVGGTQAQSIPIYVEVPAGNYITGDFDNYTGCTIIGVETNV